MGRHWYGFGVALFLNESLLYLHVVLTHFCLFFFFWACVSHIFSAWLQFFNHFPDEFTMREWYFGGKPDPDPYEMVPPGFVPNAEQIAAVEALGPSK